MGFIPIIGMAMQVGGAIANHIDKKNTEKAVAKIGNRARDDVEDNSARAMGLWGQSLDKLTPEQQEAMQKEQADKRMTAFEQATADVPDATQVVGPGAPQIVRNDAAKKLGDKLAEMTSMMSAKSRLGGWDDRGLRTGFMLNRSGQQINQLGDFSRGTTLAAQQAMDFRSRQKSPIGDMLMGVGSMMTASGGMMGGGGAGGAGGMASMFGGGGGAAPSMIPANTTGSSLMNTATNPNWWQNFTTPWGPKGVKLW